jgi:hypothetical protein
MISLQQQTSNFMEDCIHVQIKIGAVESNIWDDTNLYYALSCNTDS